VSVPKKATGPRAGWGTSFHDVRLSPEARVVFRRVAKRLRVEGLGVLPIGIALRGMGPGKGNPFSATAIAHYALLSLEAALDAAKKGT